MVYTVKYPRGLVKIDSDKVAEAFMKGSIIGIRTSSKDERIRILDMLEADGFKSHRDWTRAGAIDSGYPLVVFLSSKSYMYIPNVTCGAAVSGTIEIIGSNEFYVLYSYYKLINSDK
jgi:hypothetical protein